MLPNEDSVLSTSLQGGTGRILSGRGRPRFAYFIQTLRCGVALRELLACAAGCQRWTGENLDRTLRALNPCCAHRGGGILGGTH